MAQYICPACGGHTTEIDEDCRCKKAYGTVVVFPARTREEAEKFIKAIEKLNCSTQGVNEYLPAWGSPCWYIP